VISRFDYQEMAAGTMADYIWELRNPDGGMLGMEVARSLMEATDTVLGHALPERVDIEVRDQEANLVANGTELKADQVPHELRGLLSRLEVVHWRRSRPSPSPKQCLHRGVALAAVVGEGQDPGPVWQLRHQGRNRR
jgi:hypothetical protein